MAVRILATMLWAWSAISSASASEGNPLDRGETHRYSETIAQSGNLFGGNGQAEMAIDIKPGDLENIVRASSGRSITVAIFGSENLEVVTINPRTIRLNGVDIMLVGKSDKSLCNRPADINGDDYDDLVCVVNTTGFKVGEGEYKVILKAGTYHGDSLQGEDKIRVVLN